MAGIRKQAQACCRDDSQRPLTADEHLLEIVARRVLAQRSQGVQNSAIGEYDFKAQHQGARRSIPADINAAGIGRDIAANLATAFGPKA